jgi:hypothetical protein
MRPAAGRVPPAAPWSSDALVASFADNSAVSRWDRLLVFGGLNITAAILFVVCLSLLPTPVFVTAPRKFAVL